MFIFLTLTHTEGMDIVEKITPETGDQFEKHYFCTNMPLSRDFMVARDFMESQWLGGK